MSTTTAIGHRTEDTAETVTAPVLPADDRPGDGYDWMDTLEGAVWAVLPNWGSEGWDAGSWPYIIFAVARTRDRNGELFGYGTCVEGDTPPTGSAPRTLLRRHHYRGVLPLVTRPVRRPDNLPATAADLPDQDRKPCRAGQARNTVGVPATYPPGHPMQCLRLRAE
jgi:hypothetical protein